MIPGVSTIKGIQQALTGVNLVTGKKLSAVDRWAEVGGIAASLIPIPGAKIAGKYATKAVIKGISKATDFIGGLFKKKKTEMPKKTKAEILDENKKAGIAAGKQAAEDLIKQGNKILGSQVSVRTSAGIRRIDHLIMDTSGKIKAIEVKSGNARNSSQIRKDSLLEKEGGVIVGKNAPEELIGETIKIPTIEMNY